MKNTGNKEQFKSVTFIHWVSSHFLAMMDSTARGRHIFSTHTILNKASRDRMDKERTKNKIGDEKITERKLVELVVLLKIL